MSELAAAFSTLAVRVHTRHGIRTLSFDALAALFSSTAKQAAEKLGISSRTLIRVCRSLGIRRWPYLGFRGERSAERIRQDAIANLRHRFEARGGGPTPADTVLPSGDAAVRGASAKRLLQLGHPLEVAEVATTHSDGEDQSTRLSATVNALVTPLAASGRFRFDRQRVSPRKVTKVSMPVFGTSKITTEILTVPSLPLLVDASLPLLVDASLQDAHRRPRTRVMSMRDILSSAPAETCALYPS